MTKRLRTLLTLFLLVIGTSVSWAELQDFEIDLKENNPVLPTGVEATYDGAHGPCYNGGHGWANYVFKFTATESVKITMQKCAYGAYNNITACVKDAVGGNILGELNTQSSSCDGEVSWIYISDGTPKDLYVHCGAYCHKVKVEKVVIPEDFEIDLQTATPVLPTGVKQIKYTEHGPYYHQDVHGWCWYGIEFYVDRDVNITIGGCDYQNGYYGYLEQEDGTRIADITNDKCDGTFTYKYTGGLQKLKLYCGQYCPSIKVSSAQRTFEDFAIEFRTNPYTVVKPTTNVLPSNVTVDAGSYHGNQHGAQNATVTVKVDGPVSFKIGGCQFTNHNATVSIDGGSPINIETKAAGCDDAYSASNPKYNNYATYVYNSETPATLTFKLGDYCPYIMAEACELIETAAVSYYDTDGSLIGKEDVSAGSALAYKYGAGDVTVASGKAFRGWFENATETALKVKEGKIIVGNIDLYAKATDIEEATVGSHFSYNLTAAYFYPEDHELINMDGRYYNNHGWILGANDKITVQVAGNCHLVVKNCFYSNEQEAIVTDGNDTQVGKFQAKAATDGADVAITYTGPATTLTITFPGSTTYVHGIEVFNVASPLNYDEETHTYTIPAGDENALKIALKVAKEGDIIYLPNGTYDFGTEVNTTVSTNNLSIIGESRDGVIIKNHAESEGIQSSATIHNISTGLYLQDLTLNCYATPKNGNERGVALWDQGTRTICKNVYLKGYQDTYYSNGSDGMIAYFEGGKIEGTVDFICGSGNVLFNGVNINCTSSNTKPSGACIAAPSTYNNEVGYVVANSLITGTESQNGTFRLARGWQNYASIIYTNTECKLDKGNEYWGNPINTLEERRFAYYPSTYDVNARSESMGNLVKFVNYVKTTYNWQDDWDPAAIIASHCPVKTNAAGWASMTTYSDIKLNGGAQAFTGLKVKAASVVLESIDDIPALTGLFIKGEPNSVYTYERTTSPEAERSENLIVSVMFDKALTSADKAYVLGTLEGKPGIFKVVSDVTVPAGKAYLDASVISTEAKMLEFIINDGATDIENVGAASSATNARYNMAGQKVDKNYKGIVISNNGKKYIVK